MFGHTFYDGKEETVTVDDRMAEKLTGNKHFACGEPEDVEVEPQADDDAKVAAAKAEDDAKGTAQGYSAAASRGADQPAAATRRLLRTRPNRRTTLP